MFKLLTVVFLVVSIVGCSAKVEPKSADATTVTDGRTGGADVKLVTLNDGTRCAVLIGYNKGSIDCDWRRHE